MGNKKPDLIFRITMTVLWFYAATIFKTGVGKFIVFIIAGISLSYAIILLIKYIKDEQ